MRIQSLAGAWEFRQAGMEEWLPASVPGCVHTDLLALDRIPDPFVGDNEKRVQWVAEADWEYRYPFRVEPNLLDLPQIWMVCDGLDTLATVSLNGRELGRTANMFRQYRWDVKTLVEAGENDLRIAFASPVRFAAAQEAIRSIPGVSQAIPGGPYLRKAPCQFGWDWGPQLPPIGIWKDIRLEGVSNARLSDVHLRQRHTDGRVTVTAALTTERWTESPLNAKLTITAPDGEVLVGETAVSQVEATTIALTIPEPQLWWPNGYGEQPLYQVVVRLHQGDTILDQRNFQLGLRTIELHQEEDQWGRSFAFIVNDVPIFAKGADWIPADSFPTRITDENLERLIRFAVESHQNMLRVWGGGVYEDERFYDLCDRYGILVWQDFIFACSVYPLHEPEFVDNVHQEVVENMRRLRHRASLALWCGNNEMEWGWAEWGWTRPDLDDLKDAYDRFFHQTLPECCEQEDPDHTYWPSSPSSGTPFADPNGQKQGNAHYWDVWHGGQPFTAYRQQYPRFMSEFGFQALPPLATIRTFADEDDWNMTSYIMEQHQKNDRGNSMIVRQMLDSYRLPKDFPALVYLSMVLQAEGIRYGVEHWRRHRDRVAGTLYWQLNDCWPVASWSSLDYFGRWKALHYAARRFYAPLLLSIEDKPSEQDIYITSDLRDRWEGSVRWSLEMLDGEVLEKGEESVTAAPLSVTTVSQIDFSDRLNADLCREVVFIAELLQDGQILSRQTAFFVPTKHLALREPEIAADLSVEQGEVRIELVCKALARQVECDLEGADVVFSDNYFDLPAGRTVNISAPLPAGWTLSQAQAALKVRSVYDSYA